MLGIIGGMGPMASSLFYDMITEKTGAGRDQENLDLILLSHSTMPDRTMAILSGEEKMVENVKEKLLVDAKYIEKTGCDAIAVTCNTAHYFIDMIEDQVGIPFIHMIREAARECAKRFPWGKVGILATDGTIKTELYQKALDNVGIEAYVPTPETQKKIMSQIYDRIKAGLPADGFIWSEIEKEIKEAGCNGALLACTELSVIKLQLKLDDYYIDPMEVMADRAIEFFREKGEIK